MEDTRDTIAVDFDGVLHQYEGWNDGKFGLPIEGAAAALTFLREQGFRILIHTVRAVDRTYKGQREVSQLPELHAWLKQHGIPYDDIWTSPGKPMAKVYIDDRAVRFAPQIGWDDFEALVRKTEDDTFWIRYNALHAMTTEVVAPLLVKLANRTVREVETS